MTDVRITKACPECGRQLVVRVSRQHGGEFLGCVGYMLRDHDDRPRCQHTEEIPEYLRQIERGAALLPGF